MVHCQTAVHVLFLWLSWLWGFQVFFHDLLAVVFRSSFSITIGIWFYVPFGICKKNVLNEINHVYDLSSFDFR